MTGIGKGFYYSGVMKHDVKTLTFITKNYPPAIGGMENYCRDLVKYLRKSGIVVNLVANGKGKKWLPLFAFKAFFQWLRYAWKSDAIWIGDGSISFFGWVLSVITRKPRYVTIHALDITWNKRWYQQTIPRLVKQATHVVAVSTYTKEQCIARGIPAGKITVIPNGIDPERMPEVTISKESLMKQYDIAHSDKTILFSIGRHIERKGIHVFLEEVMPTLWNEYIYVIAWLGPYTEIYKQIIARKWLSNVYCIGRIDDHDKVAFYKHSDRFVMPNIPVEGDAEWFGIVCIEAGWYGCPVITTGIEGIRDAVVDGVSGAILPLWDQADYRIQMLRSEVHKQWVKLHIQEKSSWKIVVQQYNDLLNANC